MVQKKPLKNTLLMLYLRRLKTTIENPEIFFNSQLSLAIWQKSSYSGVVIFYEGFFLSSHILGTQFSCLLSEHCYTVANKLKASKKAFIDCFCSIFFG